MSYRREVEVVAKAIREAERCPMYDQQGMACDGLDGCDDCLELAAKAALRSSEETR